MRIFVCLLFILSIVGCAAGQVKKKPRISRGDSTKKVLEIMGDPGGARLSRKGGILAVL